MLIARERELDEQQRTMDKQADLWGRERSEYREEVQGLLADLRKRDVLRAA